MDADDPVGELVSALRASAERYDRVAAVELYRAYESALAARGAPADDRAVEAYREALWRPQPKADDGGALPRPGTPYVGRARETARVVELLVRGGAVVTLSGVAGVGKTRLALAAAERCAAAFPDGLRYLELPRAGDAAAVLARTLAGEELRTLVILDDVEPMVEQAGAAVAAFRTANPRSSVLIASRRRTGIAGEHAIIVAPLALPLADASAAVIARTPAIAFFIERAALARPGFAYDERDAADLAHVCAALDGLPLALELAAAQVRFFSVRELARRVARPEFAPTSLDSTLRATIELLDRDERRLFARLAVFEHPWTIAEAEAVCAGAELAEDVVLPAIARLVERSLVQTQTSDRVVRHRLLDTVRRVALKTGEDERAACRERAVDWYAGAMVRLGLDGIPDGSAMEQLAERHDGMCSVLDRWCADDRLVLRAVASTRKYWEWRGLAAESLVRIDARAATAVDDDPDLAFAVARTVTTHALAVGDNARAERGVAEMERFAAGDEARLIEVWHNAAILAYNAGRLDDAQALLERVAALQSARAMTVDHARTAMNLAAIALARRDWDGAEQRLAAIAHVDHSRNEAVFVARNRAYAAAMRGEFDAARAFAADAVRRCADPAVGAEWRVEVQHVLGIIAYQAGEPYEAIRRQQLALLAAPRPPFRLAALPLEHAALAAAEIGQTAEAAQVLGYVDARRDRARLHRSPEFETFFGELRSRLGRLLGARLAEHTRVGASLAPERAAEIVFSLPTERPPGGGLAGLSDREREVAALLAHGATNREIAARLIISVKTVENHLSSIFAKLRVTRRSHVAVMVREGQLAAEHAAR